MLPQSGSLCSFTPLFCGYKLSLHHLLVCLKGPSLLMHEKLPRSQLTSLSLNLSCIVLCCLCTCCLLRSRNAIRNEHRWAGSAKIECGSGRLAGFEINGCGCLPSAWALTLNTITVKRPSPMLVNSQNGGWPLNREWALTQDNYMQCYQHQKRAHIVYYLLT